MKNPLAIAACLILATVPAHAQTGQVRVESIIVPKENGPRRAFIIGTTPELIRYHESAITTTVLEYPMADVASVFFLEPRPFIDAMQMFRARDYAAALAGFSKIARDYQAVRMLPDNPSTRAAFFEMECLRMLGEYKTLGEKLANFNRTPLTRETEVRQVEINVLWEAVASKEWDRLAIITRQLAGTRLPGNQRAQVAYCEALAHDNKDRPAQALNAYNVAMTADSGASEVITRNAALAILRILDADPEVRVARDLWGTERERKNSSGYLKLLEAGAVARMFNAHLGAGAPLPAEFQDYPQYDSKQPAS